MPGGTTSRSPFNRCRLKTAYPGIGRHNERTMSLSASGICSQTIFRCVPKSSSRNSVICVRASKTFLIRWASCPNCNRIGYVLTRPLRRRAVSSFRLTRRWVPGIGGPHIPGPGSRTRSALGMSRAAGTSGMPCKPAWDGRMNGGRFLRRSACTPVGQQPIWNCSRLASTATEMQSTSQSRVTEMRAACRRFPVWTCVSAGDSTFDAARCRRLSSCPTRSIVAMSAALTGT